MTTTLPPKCTPQTSFLQVQTHTNARTNIHTLFTTFQEDRSDDIWSDRVSRTCQPVVTVSNIEQCLSVLIHCDTMRRVRISTGHIAWEQARSDQHSLIQTEKKSWQNTWAAKPRVFQMPHHGNNINDKAIKVIIFWEKQHVKNTANLSPVFPKLSIIHKQHQCSSGPCWTG